MPSFGPQGAAGRDSQSLLRLPDRKSPFRLKARASIPLLEPSIL
jgi:hypothetical protein